MPQVDTLNRLATLDQSTLQFVEATNVVKIESSNLLNTVLFKPVSRAVRWGKIVDGSLYKGLLGSTSPAKGGTLTMDAYWDGAIRNRRHVLDALTKNPKMNGLLVEASKRLDPLFPNGRLILEGDSDGEQLYLVVETALDIKSARVALDDFDRSWWLENMGPANGNLSVVLELV